MCNKQQKRNRVKIRMTFIWVLAVLVLGVSVLNADISIAQTSRKKYKKITTKNIPYGPEKESVGFLSIKNLPRRGPESFSNDTQGNLYICDTVNTRIQILSPIGDHLYAIPLEEGMVASDIAVDRFGYIYIYDSDRGKLYQYDKKGDFLNEVDILKRWSSRRHMHIIDNKIYMRSADQEDVIIGKVVKGSLVVPSAEELSRPIQKGIHGFSGRRYFVKLTRWEKGEIDVIHTNGNTIKRIGLPLKGIVSISFLQEDRKGNFYIQTERVANEKVLLELHKFESDGNYLTTVPIPETDYDSWTIKLLSLDENGTIYQFLPSKERGRLNIFRQE